MLYVTTFDYSNNVLHHISFYKYTITYLSLPLNGNSVVMQFEHYKGTKGKYNLAKKNVRERLTEVFGRVFS